MSECLVFSLRKKTLRENTRPYRYHGLKIFTSLRLRFQDFQRTKGKEPFSKYKHISDSVGVGTIELIENGRPAYRTLYVAKYDNAVYVLHSFTKTTNGVDRKAMATAKRRHKTMMAELKK